MVKPHSIEDEAVATEAVDTATLLAENASLRDRLLHALAEAENIRRRADRATAEKQTEKQTWPTAESAALVEGVRATLRVLVQTLEQFGIRRIKALGERFDPNLHEAVVELDDPSQPPETVVRVVEDGYTIHDFVEHWRGTYNPRQAMDA